MTSDSYVSLRDEKTLLLGAFTRGCCNNMRLAYKLRTFQHPWIFLSIMKIELLCESSEHQVLGLRYMNCRPVKRQYILRMCFSEPLAISP